MYSTLVFDIAKKHPLFQVKEEIVPSQPQVKRVYELKPDYYLLKIICQTKFDQSKSVMFNDDIISAFKVHKENAKETAYFYLTPDQMQKDNSLKINFGFGFPKEVVIRLKNYRNSYMCNNAVVFFRSAFAFLFEFSLLRIIAVFLLAYFCFTTIFFFSKETYSKIPIYIIITPNIFFTALAINNLLPLTPYIVYVNLPHIWFLLLLVGSSIFGVLHIKKLQPNPIQEARIKELPTPNMRCYTTFVFLGLSLFLFMLRLVLLLYKRVPMRHDTFQYLQLQYNLFFNEPALNKTVPQWLPFMTHGAVSNIWIIISQGLLTSILVPFANLLKHINFLYLFQAGLLFDEIVLLLGCVLLAKRLFKSVATVLFVACSITFTTISSAQIWWDFHLIYLFPLTLYCIDRALKEASAKYLFLSGIFFLGMLLGNLPYFAPILAFTVSVLGLMILFYDPYRALTILKKFLLSFRWLHLVAILIPCLLAFCVFMFMKDGVNDVISYSLGRSSNLSNNIKVFLSYGGHTNINKYLEFISPSFKNIDNTIYAGSLLVPFAILTLLRVRSRLSYAIGTTAVVMILFSAGIGIPLIFYYVFPFAKYFRHIGLVSPLAKLFMILYAGFGFDMFWKTLRRLRLYSDRDVYVEDRINLRMLFIIMLSFFILFFFECFSQFTILAYSSMSNQLLVIIGLFVILMFIMLRWPRQAVVIGLVFISVHLINVVSFKFEHEYRRVPHINKDVMDLFNTYDYSFSYTRNQNYFSNDRFLKLAPSIFYEDKVPVDTDRPTDPRGKYGALYWNLDSFLFFDPVSHIFRTEHWLKWIDAFYSVWVPRSERNNLHVGFPMPQSVAFNKLTGYGFPKLQLFSKIHVLPDENDVAEILANPDFQGDMLLSSDPAEAGLAKISIPFIFNSKENIKPQTNERISNAEITVKKFTFDKLKVSVNNDTATDAVLYYADAWHPKWHAYVDSKPVFVFKTNIGYKSIAVPPGKSEVIFQFGDTTSKLLFNGLIVIGISVFFGVIYLLLTELRR